MRKENISFTTIPSASNFRNHTNPPLATLSYIHKPCLSNTPHNLHPGIAVTMLLSLRSFMLLFTLGSFVLLSTIDLVNAEPKVISMQTSRKAHSALSKRDAPEVPLGNWYYWSYFVSATIGTPAQNVSFSIGTSVSDTWLAGSELTSNNLNALMGSCKYLIHRSSDNSF